MRVLLGALEQTLLRRAGLQGDPLILL